jgi:Xaa-Pro aminopeptidase
VKSIYCNIQEHEKFKPEYPQRDQRMMEILKTGYPAHEFKRLAPVMAELRCLKEPEELELIRRAVEITGGGLERVLSFIQPGVFEYQVEAELSHEFIRQGAGGHAYAPIIASGENACMLHYINNDRVCLDGELVLMDFGAEYANYAADCTRTVPVNGKFSKRQKELYDACLRVFRNTSRLIQPGTRIDDINKEVGKLWEEEHLKLGLYTADELKKQDKMSPLYRKYYPHGTCHFVGLDVHDAGSNQAVLQPGMVLTCEPGIYIPEEKTGIRLENMILVTESGNEDMMKDFPVEPGEIEACMNKNR